LRDLKKLMTYLVSLLLTKAILPVMKTPQHRHIKWKQNKQKYYKHFTLAWYLYHKGIMQSQKKALIMYYHICIQKCSETQYTCFSCLS